MEGNVRLRWVTCQTAGTVFPRCLPARRAAPPASRIRRPPQKGLTNSIEICVLQKKVEKDLFRYAFFAIYFRCMPASADYI